MYTTRKRPSQSEIIRIEENFKRSLERNSRCIKTFGFNKPVVVDYDQKLKDYIDGKTDYKSIGICLDKTNTNKVKPELLVDALSKHLCMEEISIDELNSAIKYYINSINILEENLDRLEELAEDPKSNEEQIRQIYTDVDETLTEDTKSYINKYCTCKIKSLVRSIKIYEEILNDLQNVRDSIINDNKKPLKINLKDFYHNLYQPFIDTLFPKLKPYVTVRNRILKLYVSDKTMDNMLKMLKDKYIVSGISKEFKKELGETRKHNCKRTNKKEENIKDKKVMVAKEKIENYAEGKYNATYDCIRKNLKVSIDSLDEEILSKSLLRIFDIQKYEKDELVRLKETLNYFITNLEKNIEIYEEKPELIEEGKTLYLYKVELNNYQKLLLYIEYLMNLQDKDKTVKMQECSLYVTKIDFLDQYIKELKNIGRAIKFIDTYSSDNKSLKLSSLANNIYKD